MTAPEGVATAVVVAPYQVAHEGRVFMPGETVSNVPDDVVELWQSAGWVQ